MKKEELKELTDEDLKKKEKSLRTLGYVFIPLLIALPFLFIHAYRKGEGVDMTLLVISLCSVAGLLSIRPTLRMLQEEMEERGV